MSRPYAPKPLPWLPPPPLHFSRLLTSSLLSPHPTNNILHLFHPKPHHHHNLLQSLHLLSTFSLCLTQSAVRTPPSPPFYPLSLPLPPSIQFKPPFPNFPPPLISAAFTFPYKFTNLLNLCLTNFGGHILSRTAEMLTRAVVAITKGEKFESPASHALVLAGRPTAVGPSAAGPSSSSLPSAETPPAPSPANPSTKFSLQMQKEELVKAGYEKDFICKYDEAAMASLLDKEGAKEQPSAKEAPSATQEYLI